ncbi:potassium-transporting ATPase subunit C [Streptomyces sp. NPDC020681]|uniref:potassium-transporting ATPase subunit C n=1 Tax=Streptomyces sp. NPDC020681 TaxID=3365083 RepID=UPI0037A7DDA3
MNNSFGNAGRLIIAGLRALLVLTVVTGVIYPLAVTGVAQALFNDKANGSEIKSNGKVVGSELIGQTYNLPKKDPNDAEEAAVADLKFFQPRPSNGLGSNSVNTQYSLILSGATNRSGDNGAVDGECPTDPKKMVDPSLCKWVVDAKDAVVKDNSVDGYKVKPSDVPADAITSSASGLDPDISPEYADIQVHRVAKLNGLDVKQVQKLVDENTDGRILGFMGEPTVNVLKLNIALRELTQR